MPIGRKTSLANSLTQTYRYSLLPYTCFMFAETSGVQTRCRQPYTMSLVSLQPLGLLLVTLVSMTLCYWTNKCPATCSLSNNRRTCYCRSGYWNRIPELPPDITGLLIQNSNMTYLPTGAFRSSPNLTTVHLDKNNIRVIADHAFDGLTQLIALKLDKNKLSTLSRDSLSGLTNFIGISLNYNLFRVLPVEALCDVKNMTALRLTGNKLTDIHFGACFKRLKYLTLLDLSGNIFKTLSSQNFSGLCTIKITELYIESCQIHELSPDTFECLKKLKNLSLKNNHIFYMPNDMFKGLKLLRYLNIIDNPIAVFNSKLIAPLGNLQELHIGNPKWTSLVFGPEFQNLSSLRALRLENIRMETLKNNTFRSLVTCPVDTIYFEKCHFRTMESGSLSYFPKLKMLILLDTGLSQHLQATLDGFKSPGLKTLNIIGPVDSALCGDLDNIGSSLQARDLAHLVLTDCVLKRISRTLLGNLTNLETLDLSSNALLEAEAGSLRFLRSLKILRLDQNKLTTCPSGTWLGVGKGVKTLSLDHNRIGSLGGDSLAGYGSLQHLYLMGNAIRKIFDQPFKETPHLKYLYLANNKISTLRHSALPPCLLVLRLESNRLQTIAEDALTNLTDLIKLQLSHNILLGKSVRAGKLVLNGLRSLKQLTMTGLRISEVPHHLFSNLTNLEVLSLHGNSITSWDWKAFLPLTRLKMLGLSANKITSLNEKSYIDIADTLQEIDLSGNPFACTCDLLWFRQYMMTGNVIFLGFPEGKANYACASPESLRGVPLLNFHISSYDCLDKMEIGALFGFFITCLVFGVCTSLVLKYWWHIRYYWFVLQAQRKQQKELLHQPQYRFDAFVCYHSDDRHWVIRKLLPNIEYDGGYDVCLHDRNWLGGIDIAENILMSIDRSRKVIMVLTNKFAASQWCQFEVAMAQHRLLEEGRDVLIPVLMEEIEGRNLTARLRHVLNTKTYLAWPREENKEAKFWGALRKALKRRPRVI